jgi:formate-dependent nitrite reductase membrane component NrfD
MEDPSTEIAQLLSRQPVKARKAEKGTGPNLFYIDADESSLVPSSSEKLGVSLWGSQSRGVGHFAKEAEKFENTNVDLVSQLVNINGGYESDNGHVKSPRTVEVVMDKAKEVYNTPDKGILWGWEVSAYVWTKAISAGAFLVPFVAWLFGLADVGSEVMWWGIGGGLVFLTLTGVFLVMDLDQPTRFAYVLLRPQWDSWLVRGGYAITLYGGLLTLLGAAYYFNWEGVIAPIMVLTGVTAAIVAIYTAFLFAQAKGRDFWQSPTLSIHMLVHSFMAGAGFFLLVGLITGASENWSSILGSILLIGIVINLFTMFVELVTTHPTKDAKTTVSMILKGRYKSMFWGGIIFVGNIIPLTLLAFAPETPLIYGLASILMLAGIYITEHVWVEAPQRIPLS